METISWEVLHKEQGQVGPYADSIYRYKVVSNLHETQVKRFCTEFLRKSKKQKQNGDFSGTSNFPFGLDSYYKLEKPKGEDGTWYYTVCEPYIDY